MMSPEIEGPGAASLRRACEEAWSAALEWERAVNAHWHSPRAPRYVPTVWDGQITFEIGRRGFLTIVGGEGEIDITGHLFERSRRWAYVREATRLVLRAARWYRRAAERTIAYSQSRAKARAAILDEARTEAAELLLSSATSQNDLAYIADKWATRVFDNVRARVCRQPVVNAPKWILSTRDEPVFGCTRPVYWWLERVSGSRWVFGCEHGAHTPLTVAPDYLIADLLLLCRQAERWLRRNP